MGRSATKNINIEVEAKVEGAAHGFDKLGKSIGKATSASDKAHRAFGKFDSRAKKVEQTQKNLAASMAKSTKVFLGLGSAASAVMAVRKVGELADEGLRAQQVMANLAFSIDGARAATRGFVSDLDLATAANTAAMLGVVETAGEFTEFSAAASKLGQVMGVDAAGAVEKLTIAIGRGSTRRLDDLGIMLKLGDAQIKYAKSLDKSLSALSEEQRASAFKIEAMKMVIAAAENVTEVTDGSAAAVKRFAVELENIKHAALGAEEKKRDLVDVIREMSTAERELIKDSKTYGTAGRDVTKMLRERQSAVVSVTAATKVLAAVERAERSAAMDGLLDGSTARKKAEAERTLAAQQQIADNKEFVAFFERELEMAGAREDSARNINTLEQQLYSLKVDNLELEGDLTAAAELRWKAQLGQARFESRKRGGGGKRDRRSALEQSLEGFDPQDRGDMGWGEAFGTQGTTADPFEYAEQQREIEEAKAEVQLSVRMRAIEDQRAMGVEPIQLIEAEKQAQMEHVDFLLNEVEPGSAEFIRLQDTKRQHSHDAHLKRLRAEHRAEAEQLKRRKMVFNATSAAASGAASVMVASARAAGRGEVQAQAIAATILLAVETAKAAASYATLNIPGGIAHTAAAALAGIAAGQAWAEVGNSGGGGGGGGAQFAPPPASTSPAPSTVGPGGGPPPPGGGVPLSPSDPISPRSGPSDGGKQVHIHIGTLVGSDDQARIELRRMINESDHLSGRVV